MEMIVERSKSSQWRKATASALAGAVVAAIAMIGVVQLYERGAFGAPTVSEAIAAVTGLVYLLLAVQVGVGVASPGFGARFMNVEDEQDLREQRRILALSAAAMVTWGAALIVLALAGQTGVLTPGVALVVATVLFVAGVLATVVMWRHLDELLRAMSRECGNLSFYLIAVLGGGWAALAQLGFAAGPAPLDWLTMFYVLPLAASFIGAGRRGMLMR